MYLCALRPMGTPIASVDVVACTTALKTTAAAVDCVINGPFAALATSSPRAARPYLARWNQLVGAGDVRLDNRADIARLGGMRNPSAQSDLELVLGALDAMGERCIPQLLGDFAFVVWDAHAQKLLAVRDAFGVKTLYYRKRRDLVLWSSDLEPLCDGETYDLDYFRDYLAGYHMSVDRTAWRDVSALPAAHFVRQRGTVETTETYWRAADFLPAANGDERTNCQVFRDLLERAVQTRLTGTGDVWAQLSGGLDSSTIVAIADVVRGNAPRLAGTITVVDSLGDGDERTYSDAVVRRYRMRNEVIHDHWAWQDDGEPPPITDQPPPMYPFYARDRKLRNIVHAAGGRVLLSGIGADHYLTGTLDYITDMMSARRWRAAVREVTAWAVATRQSFWTLGRQTLVDPFVPPALHPGRLRSSALPPWLNTTAGSGLAVRAGQPAPSSRRFAMRTAAALETLPGWLDRTSYHDDVELRYPFLYRPLVEWSLRLPVDQRIRPNVRKWILREATRDVLPEEVRTRTTKGGIDARILWSLQREHKRLQEMLRNPILAELGCIDAVPLRAAVERARRGASVHSVHLFSALSLETWLAVRNGRWFAALEPAASAA
jgi:asparagine synthase (glutamine-hydrolysing)